MSNFFSVKGLVKLFRGRLSRFMSEEKMVLMLSSFNLFPSLYVMVSMVKGLPKTSVKSKGSPSSLSKTIPADCMEFKEGKQRSLFATLYL